jgi:hypothetical protein
MVCPRVDEIGKTELFDVSQALERGRIQQAEGKILHFDIPVDRVLDDLHSFTKESSYTSHKSIE